MGSVFDWISVARVSDALGVSVRSVWKYVSSGQLASRKEGRHTLVSRSDVKALIDARKRGITRGINAMTVARLEAEVQVMKKQLETVMRMLDIRYDPLDLSNEDLGSLYLMAEHHLKTPWGPHEEVMWCDVFVRLRVEDMEKIEEATGDQDPWRPFFSLSKAMMAHPHNNDNKLILSAGANNVERIAFAWSQKVEKRRGADIQKMIKKDDVLSRRIGRKMERILAKQQKAVPGEE